MSWFHWKHRMATKFVRSQTLDYHVWGPMLGCYQKYTPKPPNIAELKIALVSIWNDLPQEFIDKAISSFRKRLPIVCCCSWWTCLTQFKYREGSWSSSLKRWNCWRKNVQVWLVITEYSGCDCMFTWKTEL